MKFFRRFLPVFATFLVLATPELLTAVTQTTKAKPTAVKPKPTPVKKPSPPKSTESKAKAVQTKPKPKPKITAAKTPDEKTEWARVASISGLPERIEALRKFLKTFPEAEHRVEAESSLASASADLGNASIAAGDLSAAAANFKAAVTDTPSPVGKDLFDTLSKFAANLYFRGLRTEAFETESILERKAATNADQLLVIASFYMSVENGAEARRVADAAIKLVPASSPAYQALGLANRIDFRLDDAAAAYAKALELDPESLIARRGLAEMKRSTGKADDAAALYREILAKDAANIPAQTGLVLALFEAGKVGEAEIELTKTIDANPGNVILLAGAAYWYAVNKDGEKAVSLAQRAVASDPRFIWSHIALARGYLIQNNTTAAERALIAARRYGNFPTLEYELASVRMAAGYYREAAEELAKSFSVKDGSVRTLLGGRVERESKDFTELIGFERRASIFAPTAADSPENASRMTALLELKQELDSREPRPEVIGKAVDDLVRGDDKMKVHRQLFAANQLLDKKVALPKVIELAKAAVANVDAGLEVPNPSIAVMGSELYENRTLAASRGEFLNIPEVPRQTLSSILRGQIEELQGWTLYQTEANDDAIVHLKRAVAVLPADSAWWRSSTWRLASALAKSGKDAEALDFYIRSYRAGAPNIFGYGVIEAQYKKVNGTLNGLEAKIGARPAGAGLAEAVAQKVEPTPTPAAAVKPEPTVEAKPESTPAVVPVEAKPSETPAPSPSPAPIAAEQKAPPEPTPETKPSATPEVRPVIEATSPTPAPTEEPKISPSPTPAPVATQTPTPLASPAADVPQVIPSASPESKTAETRSPRRELNVTKDLFPPVVITIPPPAIPGKAAETPMATPKLNEEKRVEPNDESKPTEKTPAETVVADSRPRVVVTTGDLPEIKPCSITVSEDTVSLQSGGGDLAVIVARNDDADELDGLTAVSNSPENVVVRREPITGVRARALFVLRAKGKAGVYQVAFQLPCGRKEIVVKVR